MAPGLEELQRRREADVRRLQNELHSAHTEARQLKAELDASMAHQGELGALLDARKHELIEAQSRCEELSRQQFSASDASQQRSSGSAKVSDARLDVARRRIDKLTARLTEAERQLSVTSPQSPFGSPRQARRPMPGANAAAAAPPETPETLARRKAAALRAVQMRRKMSAGRRSASMSSKRPTPSTQSPRDGGQPERRSASVSVALSPESGDGRAQTSTRLSPLAPSPDADAAGEVPADAKFDAEDEPAVAQPPTLAPLVP